MKIMILSCGGTISHVPNEDGVLESNENSYRSGTFVRILKTAASELDVELSSKTIINKDSANFVMEDWKTVSANILKHYDEFDAFIVTHGTDTMGYTAAAVSFALANLGKPVVFTGAQLSYGLAGTDAVINLENCLRVITKRPDIVGVYVVFGTQIISGVRAKKKTEFDYDAFKTNRRFRALGVIGNEIIFNDQEIIKHASYLKPQAKVASDLIVKNDFTNQVVALSEFPGMSSDLIINMAKTGTRGFILRSVGDGNPNVAEPNAQYESLRPAFEYLKEHQIPIIITAQPPNGSATMLHYQPAILARELGAVPGNDISIEAAVVKLSWLLADGKSYKDILKLMQKSLRGEMS